MSYEIAGNRAIPVPTANFARAFPGAQTTLHQKDITRARQSHLCLDADLPCVPRHHQRASQFGHGAERIILLDAILRLTLCAQCQTEAVEAFDPRAIAMENGWLLGRSRLGFGKGREPLVATLG